MAPLYLLLRPLFQSKPDTIDVALEHPSQIYSGVRFSCEFNQSFDLPWGVTVVDRRSGHPCSYFGGMADTGLQAFSSALSSLLNGFHGTNDLNEPVALSLSELPTLGDKVVAFSLVQTPSGKTEVELKIIDAKLDDIQNALRDIGACPFNLPPLPDHEFQVTKVN